MTGLAEKPLSLSKGLLKLRDFFRGQWRGEIGFSAGPVRDDVWDRSSIP